MTFIKLRQKFLNFFEERRHKIVPSSSLISENRTVLLTSAGMQQFVPYLSGEKDVLVDLGTRHLASVQKCFRTLDIEKVGDDTHHTFFEMLGNWSIGEDKDKGYFKKGAIELALDFFISELGLDKNKFWITIFRGEDSIPGDEESLKIWQKQGILKERIKEFGLEDNFWGPTAETGPCGPCSEIHYDRGKEYGCKDSNCGPNCQKCNRFVELWNLVFMEYNRNKNGSYDKLPQRNVDTGIGLERLTALLQNKNSSYETDLFLPIIKKLEEISSQDYESRKIFFRIIADHIRGSVFLISDGVLPSNVEEGYILRRVLRRAIRYGKILKMPKNFLIPLASEVIEIYQGDYPEIKANQTDILTVVQQEEEKFEKTLEQGLKELSNILEWFSKVESAKEVNKTTGEAEVINSQNAEDLGKKLFFMYQTYGFPFELSIEEFEKFWMEEVYFKEEAEKSFKEELKKHQEISRAGAEKKFGGIGKEATYSATKLHTATHLFHQALREVLGNHVKQMGSDITSQRLRFDFFHQAKMTEQEIKKVEEIVNSKIKDDLEVRKEEMPYKKAIESGALAFFKEKYPEKVSVYSINNPLDSSGQVFSKEICAGPHVKHTSELGKFKIIKEESSGAGVRRIRAVLE